MGSKVDVIVFGATGFTGRLITEYLAAHPQRGSFSLGVAARSASRLRNTVDKLGLAASDIKLFTVDVNDAASVDAAVRSTRVVINTVGPFWRYGTVVVGSCVRNNVHYVDLTGEVAWVKTIITSFDWFATKTRTVIVPSCGYDSVPSDISAHLANKTLKEYIADVHPGVPPFGIATSISAHDLKTGVSGGTIASFMTAMEEVPDDLMKATQNPFCLSPIKGTPLFSPRLVYDLRVPGAGPIVGGFWVMRGSNTAIVQRTAGLLELSVREARARGQKDLPELEKRSYDPSFVYDEFRVEESKLSALISSFTILVGFLLLSAVAPLRKLVKACLPKSGAGPTLEQKETGYLHLTNISTGFAPSSRSDIKVRTDVKIKGDPGYYKTAVMISEAALCLLVPPTSAPEEVKADYNPLAALPPLARQGGILTPMTAFGDVLIQRLRDTGSFEFSSHVVEEDGASRVDRKRV